ARRRVLLHLTRRSRTSIPRVPFERWEHPPRVRTCSGSTPFRTEGVCSYIQTGILLHPNRISPRTVGAPAPGAKALWLDSLSHRGRCSYTQTGFAPGAVLLHLNRDSPASKTGFSSNCRSTRPGCEGFWTGAPGVSRRAVLRPDNRIH